jgi:hypothetical protein
MGIRVFSPMAQGYQSKNTNVSMEPDLINYGACVEVMIFKRPKSILLTQLSR